MELIQYSLLTFRMTQKEAFEFLELPESATRSQIKIRLVEKLEYFEHLSEHAPSDFLRRIHARNVEKVHAIQQEFFPWSIVESGSEVILPYDQTEIADESGEDLLNTAFVIVGQHSETSETATAPEKPAGPPGWLIRHTENKPDKAWPLQPGKNYIGRKVQPGADPFIAIDDDPYISRIHAVVHVGEGALPECFVMDSAASNNGQPSTNGTYINGNTSRVEKKESVAEGDTIQVGATKLVLQYNTKDLAEVLAAVAKSPYVSTVAINQ